MKGKPNNLGEEQLKYIRFKLIKEEWSSEYIGERGRLEWGSFVSHETIYKYIWKCKLILKRCYKKGQKITPLFKAKWENTETKKYK